MTTKSNHLRVWFPLFDVQSTHRVFFFGGGNSKGCFTALIKRPKGLSEQRKVGRGTFGLAYCLLSAPLVPLFCFPIFGHGEVFSFGGGFCMGFGVIFRGLRDFDLLFP